MGVVLAARHIHLEELGAVTLMLAEASQNHEAVTRFVREARAAARLESAHVAKVSDVGTLDDGRPYMVMEYLDGQDLSQLLASSGPLAVQDVVDYVLQAGEAIAEAHSIGIIHRDLKPSNLFLVRRRDRAPHVKVLDFGISKVLSPDQGTSQQAMTRTSTMMGSPLYMSPEQMTSVKDVDARADIWALGVILFELVTGSPPFLAETLPQVCAMVLQSPAPPASSRRPGLSRELDAVIHRCLAKDPAQRFQNVGELAVALQGMAGRQGRASLERILQLSGSGESMVAATVADVHRHPRAPASAVTPGPISFPGTHAAWGETKVVTASRSRLWVTLPVLAVASLATAAGWWFFVHSQALPLAPSVPSAGDSAPALALAPQPVAAAPGSAPLANSSPAASASAAAVAISPSAPAPPAVAAVPPLRKPSGSKKRSPSSSVPTNAAPAPAQVAAPAPAAKAEPSEPKSSDLGGRL
jgi:serine/threonine protein kinase